MAVPRTTRWPIEPHTRAKHEILRLYLEAWLPIMARVSGRVVLLDGFAGPGRYSGGEPGSPLIAMQTLLEHRDFRSSSEGREVLFLFIEADAERAAALAEEVRRCHTPEWVQARVLEGEFGRCVDQALGAVEHRGGHRIPIFAFLDPFGFAGVSLDDVTRLVRRPSCECLVSFMYESINRFLDHPSDKIQAHFDALFGTPDWRRLTGLRDPDQRRDALAALYREQLRSVAELRLVRTFEMIDRSNHTEYFLFFGTNSPVGLSKMKQAMWKVDPNSGSVFSDRTDPRQAVLLTTGGEHGLADVLSAKFRGAGFVPIEKIQRYVLEETAYSEEIHLKRKTLAVLEKKDPAAIVVRRPPGARKRAGDYPATTTVCFL